jgi:hypothetical protein
MRIHEILGWDNNPIDRNRFHNYLDFGPHPFAYDLAKLANAFTRRGLVKHFWNLRGSEHQPYEPAPPEAGTEVMPSGSLEPSTASWEAEPVETEPLVGQHRLVPFQQYRGMSGD